MPCYLFTFHAYGTWLPDREEGYVRRKTGLQPKNEEQADRYRNRMTINPTAFDRAIQRLLIETVLEAASFQALRIHYIATDPTHLHVLTSWRSEQTWKQKRTALKSSLTRNLNSTIERKEWFVKHGSRKQVRDQRHFDYLVEVYVPGHRGLNWKEGEEPPESQSRQ